MRTKIRTSTALAALGVVALSVGLLGTAASADYAPSASDVVGVGGDTPQYDVDFGFDGDTNGNLGYNAADNVNKAVSIDATADANGRTGYLNGSSLASPKNLNPTVVLRAGTNPVQCPQSTSAGIAALNADTGAIHQIDFVRVGRLPPAAEQAKAAANGWGYLHVVQLGTDNLGGVDRVRYVGDPLPPALAPGAGRLILVSSIDTGWRSGWTPGGTVYVDATLQGAAVAIPPGRRATVPPRGRGDGRRPRRAHAAGPVASGRSRWWCWGWQ